MAGVGAYGKMPSMGDFLRLNTPPGFVSVWDTWLQQGLKAARATLGEGWQASYMSAPIWRFWLGAGLAGPAPVVGVIMPSVDRVGRQFPLTLMAIATPEDRGDERLLESLEEVALSALDDAMTRDALRTALADLITPKASDLTGSLWRTAAEQGDLALSFAALPPADQMHRLFKTHQEVEL